MRPILLAAALLSIALPAELAAQSFLGFRALGSPVLATDGRTVGAGNIGIGLSGLEFSVLDPSASARLILPTVTAAMQPTWGTFELEDETGSSNTTRFPLIGVGFPIPQARGVATITLAGFMEQRWTGERTETVELGGEDAVVEDRFETTGGTSIVRIGWAQRINRRLALGISAGAYTGRLEQLFDRRLDSLEVKGLVRSYSEFSEWRYSGYTFTAGVSADPHNLVHLAGSVEWSGDIEENPRGETGGGTNAYSVPLRFAGGGTVKLTPRLMLNGSVAYQDWSTATGFPDGAVSHLKFTYGGGLEWRAIEQQARSFPLRIGYRRVVPPFRYQRYDPVETVWSAGVGINVLEDEGIRFGWIDLAAEYGNRTSQPLSERFWRGTVSLGISRF